MVTDTLVREADGEDGFVAELEEQVGTTGTTSEPSGLRGVRGITPLQKSFLPKLIWPCRAAGY